MIPLLLAVLLTAPSPGSLQQEQARQPPATSASLAALADTLSTAPAAMLPGLLQPVIDATGHPDPHIRSLAFLDLIALATRTLPDGSPVDDALRLLQPYLPTLTPHLADPEARIRELTALLCGSLLAHPTASVLEPLLATLTLPSPPPPSDISVVVALLTAGPDPVADPEIARAILNFLHRPDLPPGLLPSLINAIANHPRHLSPLDRGLLTFLDASHAPSLRADVIAILPHLALTQIEVESTRARLTSLVALPAEDAAVKAEAAAILPCWHTPRSPDPCPSPAVYYRMLPTPAKPPITPPRYQTPPLL